MGGLFLGLWIDRKLGSIPAFTIIGVIVGTVLSFYGIYKMLLPLLVGIGARPLFQDPLRLAQARSQECWFFWKPIQIQIRQKVMALIPGRWGS